MRLGISDLGGDDIFYVTLFWNNRIFQQHAVNVFCDIHTYFKKRLTWRNNEYHDRKELWAFKKFQDNQATALWNLNSRRIR